MRMMSAPMRAQLAPVWATRSVMITRESARRQLSVMPMLTVSVLESAKIIAARIPVPVILIVAEENHAASSLVGVSETVMSKPHVLKVNYVRPMGRVYWPLSVRHRRIVGLHGIAAKPSVGVWMVPHVPTMEIVLAIEYAVRHLPDVLSPLNV